MRVPRFSTFLKQHIHRKDLVGFFASEWLADHRHGKPTANRGLKGIIVYLRAHEATESMVEAASQAWSEWMVASSEDKSGD